MEAVLLSRLQFTIASTLSAFWILAANAWMQNPVGYVISNGRAELFDFFALIFGSFFINELLHTFNAASAPLTLKIILGVVLVFVPLAIAYQAWAYCLFRGVVTKREFNISKGID